MESEHKKGVAKSFKSTYSSNIRVTHLVTDTVNVNEIAIAIVSGENKEQSEANAQLIADAFNVTNETNKTPRELQKSHAELLNALEGMRNQFKGKETNGFLERLSISNAEQAIKNAKQ